MKPILCYYGGKQKIVRHILKLINMTSHKIYIEPFCGGCTVFFAKDRPQMTASSDYGEVINDKFEYLVRFYRTAVDSATSERLIQLIQSTPYARSEHSRAKNIYKNQDKFEDLECAWSCYILHNHSFANKFSGGWAYGRKTRNLPYYHANKLTELTKQIERLKLCYIECDDAIKIIKRWDSDDSLFYCDPPYVGTDQGHYKGYTEKDLEELVTVLDNIKGQFILSHYPNDICPKNWSTIEIETTMSASINKNVEKKRTEVLYYKLHTYKYSQLEIL